MPEQNVQFSYREVATALVKHAGISEGFWGILVKFGIQGTNLVDGDNKTEMVPAAVVPVLEIGLQRFSELNSLSVDASKLRAPDSPPSKIKGKRKA